MPFRYVTGSDGQPVMPNVGIIHGYLELMLTEVQGMMELIKKDSEKGFGDLF